MDLLLPVQKGKKKRESKKHRSKGTAVVEEEEGEGLIGKAPPTGAELLDLDFVDMNTPKPGPVSPCCP